MTSPPKRNVVRVRERARSCVRGLLLPILLRLVVPMPVRSPADLFGSLAVGAVARRDSTAAALATSSTEANVESVLAFATRSALRLHFACPNRAVGPGRGRR